MTYSRGRGSVQNTSSESVLLARRGAALVLFSLVLNLQCLHNIFGTPGPWVYSPGRLFDTESQPEVHSMHVSQKAGMMPSYVSRTDKTNANRRFLSKSLRVCVCLIFCVCVSEHHVSAGTQVESDHCSCSLHEY